MSPQFYPLPRSHSYRCFTGRRKSYGKCTGSLFPVISTVNSTYFFIVQKQSQKGKEGHANFYVFLIEPDKLNIKRHQHGFLFIMHHLKEFNAVRRVKQIKISESADVVIR